MLFHMSMMALGMFPTFWGVSWMWGVGRNNNRRVNGRLVASTHAHNYTNVDANGEIKETMDILARLS